jgi:hypothetical protein
MDGNASRGSSPANTTQRVRCSIIALPKRPSCNDRAFAIARWRYAMPSIASARRLTIQSSPTWASSHLPAGVSAFSASRFQTVFTSAPRSPSRLPWSLPFEA